jgi:hypothetical protein
MQKAMSCGYERNLMSTRIQVEARPTTFLVLALSLIFLFTCSKCAKAHGTFCKLQLVEAPNMIIDPSCNSCDQGEVQLLFRNDNHNVVDLLVEVGERTSSDTHKPLWKYSQITATDPVNGPALTQVLPGQFVRLTVKLYGLVEEGEWDVQILNWGTDVGAFHVIRGHRPFNVTLDVPEADHTPLIVERGKPITLPVKNQDATTYDTEWKLTIEGLSELSVDRPLPAGGRNIVVFDPDSRWYPEAGRADRLEYLLKDKIVDGNLTATLHHPKSENSRNEPTKIFPLKVHLSYYSDSSRNWHKAEFIFLILISGALISMFLNSYIPNQSRRRTLKDILKSLESDIRELPMELSSRLRVLVSVERKRLAEALNSTWSINSDFTRITDEISKALGTLQSRVQLSQQMGQLRTQFDTLCGQSVVPSVLEDVEAKFEDAVESLTQLQFGALEVAGVQGIFKDIGELLRRLESFRTRDQVDPSLSTRLAARIADLQQAVPGAPGESLVFGKLAESLGPLFAELRSFDRNEIKPDQYAHLDQVLYKLELLREFANAERLLQNASSSTDILEQEALFLSDLRHTSWISFQWARLRVRETQEGFFRGDIYRQITGSTQRIKEKPSVDTRTSALFLNLQTVFKNSLSIVHGKDRSSATPPVEPKTIESSLGAVLEISSSEPQAYQGVQLRVELANEALDHATVRDEVNPEWDFGHDDLTPEHGWSITHYFPKKGDYSVRVSFTDRSFGPIVDPKTNEPVYLQRNVKVGYAAKDTPVIRTATKLGFARLFIALVPVILALYSGASDQLSKLDVIPGIIAVFLLGFSSDQVKNLLTK